MQKPIEPIPNNPLNNEKIDEIETEYINIDDSYTVK